MSEPILETVCHIAFMEDSNCVVIDCMDVNCATRICSNNQYFNYLRINGADWYDGFVCAKEFVRQWKITADIRPNYNAESVVRMLKDIAADYDAQDSEVAK